MNEIWYTAKSTGYNQREFDFYAGFATGGIDLDIDPDKLMKEMSNAVINRRAHRSMAMVALVNVPAVSAGGSGGVYIDVTLHLPDPV